jgi:hypothetical protein
VGQCFGNPVIVGLDTKPDQLGVYFGSDGRLGIEYAEKNDLLRRKDENGNNAGGYLDPEKRNIKTLKLRGEKSDGLFMPLSSLDGFCNTSELKEGDAITVLNGVVICEKYIPRRSSPRNYHNNSDQKSKKKLEPKVKYPHFAEHSDTEQLAYNLDRFKPGDRVVLTLKMHGTSQRTAHAMQEVKTSSFLSRLLRRPAKITYGWGYISGTRRTILTPKTVEDGGYFGDNGFRMKWHDTFIGKLPRGMQVYYECVGYVSQGRPIMATCGNKKLNDKEFVKKYGDTTTFHYGCEDGESDMYVYRMTVTNEDGVVFEIPWDAVKYYCDVMGAKHVPEFERFEFTTPEDLMERVNKYLDIPDPIGKTHIAEGVVARIDSRAKFAAYKAKGFAFKCLEGIIKETAVEPDIEEAQELLEEESI